MTVDVEPDSKPILTKAYKTEQKASTTVNSTAKNAMASKEKKQSKQPEQSKTKTNGKHRQAANNKIIIVPEINALKQNKKQISASTQADSSKEDKETVSTDEDLSDDKSIQNVQKETLKTNTNEMEQKSTFVEKVTNKTSQGTSPPPQTISTQVS